MEQESVNLRSEQSWYDQLDGPRQDDPARCYRVLVADLVGLRLNEQGQPDCSVFAAHVRARGAAFWSASEHPPEQLKKSAGICFEYYPQLAQEKELLALTAGGQYDAIIAAATVIPAGSRFVEGGVRIGAGTANMASQNFSSGSAPLMNTPGFNSRATAQMVFKALLRVRPDLPFERIHERVREARFDTGRNLPEFPTAKLEGQRIAVLGYGNIGREVALIARAFGMQVAVYARSALKPWIEAEGFEFCATVIEAANGAHILSPHLGLGAKTSDGFANAGLVDAAVFDVLADQAVLINFDRGELVDVPDLMVALDKGRISQVAVDADIFGAQDERHGPLVPYLQLLDNHGRRVLLLPHAAADTDHPSRVAGALQAADQIIAAIRYKYVVNRVGPLPVGYSDMGQHSILGVGRVDATVIDELRKDTQEVASLRQQLATVDSWLDALLVSNGDPNENTIDTQGALLALSRVSNRARELGLIGPGSDL